METAVKAISLAISFLFAAPVLAAPQADHGPSADVLALRNIEVTFHTARSVLPDKSLDQMMSIYADDAVLVDTAHGSKTYSGKSEVRKYWAEVSGPFRPEHHWIGYTPAIRMHADVTGDTGTLYFECLWMEVDANVVGTHSFSDMKLARKHGRWLVENVRVGRVETL